MHNIFLSLGSNVGDRKENLQHAKRLLQEKTGTITLSSSVYETEPWGFVHNKYFYNQVICLRTKLDAFRLLKEIKHTETALGRKDTTNQYAARIIDIDILFYDDLIIETEALQLPHPLIAQRLFVLVPFEEIAPFFIHPVHNITIRQLLEKCTDKSSVKKAG